MTAIQPFRPSELQPSPSEQRRAQRGLNRLAANGTMEMARIDIEGALASAKISAFTSATHTALTSIAMLSQIESSLAMATPAASGRLAFINEISANITTQLLADFGRRL